MSSVIKYNLSFLALYWVMSVYICIVGGYSLCSYRLMWECWKGTKSLVLQLPMSNIAVMALAPHWAETQSFAGCVAYVACFDFIVYWIHTTLHAIPYLYKNVHQEHHRAHYVCPFSATTLSISEHVVIGIIPTILPLYLIPMSQIGWALTNAIFFVHGLFIHSNVRSPLEWCGFIGTREHATHHVRPKTHFGFLIAWFRSDSFPASSNKLNDDIINYYNISNN